MNNNHQNTSYIKSVESRRRNHTSRLTARNNSRILFLKGALEPSTAPHQREPSNWQPQTWCYWAPQDSRSVQICVRCGDSCRLHRWHRPAQRRHYFAACMKLLRDVGRWSDTMIGERRSRNRRMNGQMSAGGVGPDVCVHRRTATWCHWCAVCALGWHCGSFAVKKRPSYHYLSR